MKEYRKEIIICIITLLIAGGIIFFFNRSLQSEIEVEQIDLYTAIPAGSEVILHINRTSSLQWISEQDSILKKVLDKEISPVILSILNEYTHFSQGLISFHPQGTLFFIPVTPKQNQQLEKFISERWFPAYSAQIYEKNGSRFIYYPDTNGRFFGHFYIQGLWVGGYNRKLLEEAAKLYPEIEPNSSIPTEDVRKNTDTHSPLNIYIKEDIIFPDSLSLKKDSWLSADIFFSEGHICLFTVLPPAFVTGQETDSIASVFTEKINYLVPDLSLQHQLEFEDGFFYYTLCIP